MKEVLWSIDDNKELGSDGFNVYFFKKVWVIIGEDICEVIKLDLFWRGYI